MKTVVFGILGTNLDRRGKGQKRWETWRPTVSLCQHDDLLVDRIELILQKREKSLADQVTEDIAIVSPETQVQQHPVRFDDPWDFAQVYSTLRQLMDEYPFDLENERYLVHMTTGTHVAQICWFLLTEARHVPGTLIQTSPPRRGETAPGRYQEIDLDLSKYDQIASRFRMERLEGAAYLKQGIETRNKAFNAMIEQLEKVSIRSTAPILLTGPTGAGKSQLARQVFNLKKQRQQLEGVFVAVNCATLRGDNVSSTLFGHIKGSYTGATTNRAGLLREADRGLLFLDEIGELGLDEQAMLLHAIEEKSFLPLGSDREVSSDFQLIAGTNQDLGAMVTEGRFREDLLARLDLWTYQLPSLKQRIEDFEPNLEFELKRRREEAGNMVRFSKEAYTRYVEFAITDAQWRANFRDLNSSVTRMATLADGGRISKAVVEQEISLLERRWRAVSNEPSRVDLEQWLDGEAIAEIDRFDRVQLAYVIEVCRTSRSLAEAGRKIFQASREKKKTGNDSHRVRQYLGRFGISFESLSR
ncbi:MAG: RNA repair transcriptional activator RtcR [Pseudomonadales bacterium]